MAIVPGGFESRSKFSRSIWILPLIAAGMALGGCSGEKLDTGSKPVIAVSIFPVASLVGQMTEGWADVVTLLPEGAEEHDFELTANQVRQLSRADLIVLVGNGLDTWAEPKPGTSAGAKQSAVLRMGDLIRQLDRKSVANDSGNGVADSKSTASPAAAPLVRTGAKSPDDAGATQLGPPPAPIPDKVGTNNHLWLDPVLALRFVEALAGQLSERYPQHRLDIQRTTRRLSADLQDLDRSYRSELSTVQRRELITFHNAFDLIADRYGLNVVARLTDIESDPHGGITPDSYLAAIRTIKEYKLTAIYSEPEFPAEEIASIQRETAVEVFTLDPLGGPSMKGYRTYQQMMQSNLKTLVKGQDLGETTADFSADLSALRVPPGLMPEHSVDSAFGIPPGVSPTGKLPKATDRHSYSDPELKLPPLVPPLHDRSLHDQSLTAPAHPFAPAASGP